jgi:hypothetical protein
MLVLSWQYQPDKRPQRYRQLSDLAPGDVLDLARKSRRSWREVPAAQERSGGEKAGGCSGAGERISKERGEPCAVLGGGGGVGDGDKAGATTAGLAVSLRSVIRGSTRDNVSLLQRYGAVTAGCRRVLVTDATIPAGALAVWSIRLIVVHRRSTCVDKPRQGNLCDNRASPVTGRPDRLEYIPEVETRRKDQPPGGRAPSTGIKAPDPPESTVVVGSVSRREVEGER